MSTFKLRVVSYNVLSSHLASPSHYTTLLPDHLSAPNRLKVVFQKLEAELQNTQSTIFCLQEVSQEWAGSMHVWFANRGYHLLTGLYGKKFNGYMGVAIAWPIEPFQVQNVNISRLSDTREWPKPPSESGNGDDATSSSSSIVTNVSKTLSDWVISPITKRLFEKQQWQQDEWEISEYRSNIILAIQLQDKSTGAQFCIGNYHMPCAYYAPKVMTIHADLAAHHMQSFAEKNPYILAGDWNIKPTDSVYALLTTGGMDKDDPEYPTSKYGIEWVPSLLEPLQSAYASVDENGKEPHFTNHARVKDEEPFIDTLDYIFTSPHWSVLDCLPLPKKEDSKGPFPNLDHGEASDHLLIASTLELK